MKYECAGCKTRAGVESVKPCQMMVPDDGVWLAPTTICPIQAEWLAAWAPVNQLDEAQASNLNPDEILLIAIREHGGNQRAVARALGCSKATIYRRVSQNPDLRKAVREAIFLKDINREYDSIKENLKEGISEWNSTESTDVAAGSTNNSTTKDKHAGEPMLFQEEEYATV